MPINASIEFDQAKAKYEEAQTQIEKLIALQEMRSTAPSHKGAEKLRAGITGKIAKLKIAMEKQRIQAKKSSGYSINVRKEGDGQIVILGSPNTGKSYLLREITGVDVEVASYPFTTTKPEVGMMDYKGGKIQLVEVPAIIEGSSNGKANGLQLLSLARNADAIIITFSNEKEREIIVNELKNAGIIVNHKKPKISVSSSDYKGITISGGKHLKMSIKELEKVLKSFGLHNASVLLQETTTMQKLVEALDDSLIYKNCLFINPKDGFGKSFLKQKIFSILDKIIIYTKRPGQDPDFNDPLVLKKDSTIGDVAKIVHKEIAKKLRFARVWGSSKFPGQRVSKKYKLKSEDVVEVS